MGLICNCCHKEQDKLYDPYYLIEGKIVCEDCLLKKKYPVKGVSYYYYTTYSEDYREEEDEISNNN